MTRSDFFLSSGFGDKMKSLVEATNEGTRRRRDIRRSGAASS
jgi:hypothetical protein